MIFEASENQTKNCLIQFLVYSPKSLENHQQSTCLGNKNQVKSLNRANKSKEKKLAAFQVHLYNR